MSLLDMVGLKSNDPSTTHLAISPRGFCDMKKLYVFIFSGDLIYLLLLDRNIANMKFFEKDALLLK
jgi:hypothetical protein